MNRNKKIIKKEDLINEISRRCKSDFISSDILFELIDNATDENGILSKKELTKSIKDSHTKAVVRDVYNVLEDSIFDHLSFVDEDEDVCIKLFEGVALDGKFIPEKTKKNNLTGQTNLVHSKIKPKFNITRTYCEKLNNK